MAFIPGLRGTMKHRVFTQRKLSTIQELKGASQEELALITLKSWDAVNDINPRLHVVLCEDVGLL